MGQPAFKETKLLGNVRPSLHGAFDPPFDKMVKCEGIPSLA